MVDNFAAVLAFNCKINNIIQLNLDLMFFADTYSTITYILNLNKDSELTR